MPLHSTRWVSLCCLCCRCREISAKLTTTARSRLGTIGRSPSTSHTGTVPCRLGLWRWARLQRTQRFTKQTASCSRSEFRACTAPRYFLVVKKLMLSLKVWVEILPQSEMETTSYFFRNWKNWATGGWGLLLSGDPVAAVQRVLWWHFVWQSGQDVFFLLH